MESDFFWSKQSKLCHHGSHKSCQLPSMSFFNRPNSWAIPATSCLIESLCQSSGFFSNPFGLIGQTSLPTNGSVTKRPLRTEEPYSFSCNRPSDPAASPAAPSPKQPQAQGNAMNCHEITWNAMKCEVRTSGTLRHIRFGRLVFKNSEVSSSTESIVVFSNNLW